VLFQYLTIDTPTHIERKTQVIIKYIFNSLHSVYFLAIFDLNFFGLIGPIEQNV
jgi:hypothetical protein